MGESLRPVETAFDEEFRRLYETLFKLIFRVAYRVTQDVDTSEDLCHEAFIKYYKRHKSFPDENQAKYWLIRVVKNTAINSEKRKNRERNAYGRLKKMVPKYSITGEEAFLQSEAAVAVKTALKMLPYQYRIVLVLKEYEGLSYREIGSIMGISEGNVKVRVFRGREKLQKFLEENQGNVSR